MEQRNRNKKGFTLIELIAVLVILGILAVVAIPKMSDTTTKAEEAAMKGIAAAAMSQLSMSYGEMLLGDTAPTTELLAAKCTDVEVSGNKFTVSCAEGDGDGEVDITVATTTADIDDYEVTWTMP